MSGRYAANGTIAVGSSYKTALTLLGGTSVRPRLYQIAFGSTSAPADNALFYLVQRLTADGTGTSVTPNKVDPADPAAVCTSKQTYTAEPTYTSADKLFELGAHQKGFLTWQAWDQLAAIVVPATSGAGVGIQFKHASATPDMAASFHWSE